MRRSWEEPADGGLDEPVTLTARQLRSLKRGARFGLFALILALAAAGLTGWNEYRAAKEESGMNSSVASAAQQPSAAESGVAEAATTPTTTASDGAPSGAAPNAPAARAPASATQPLAAA